MSLRLGFDVDGVVADFDSGFDEVCRKLLGKELKEATDAEVPLEELSTADLKRVWKKVVSASNWWMSLQPYEPAQIERLYALSRQRKWQVFFLTKRPATAGDSVQFQTQWWLEANGFYLPSVLTIAGSRGEAANALDLDLVVDDQLRECADVIGSSTSKVVLMLRGADDQNTHDLATSRGIGVVSSLEEALDVVERVQDLLTSKRGSVSRLSEWFYPTKPAKRDEPVLPMNPRKSRPLPADDHGD